MYRYKKLHEITTSPLTFKIPAIHKNWSQLDLMIICSQIRVYGTLYSRVKFAIKKNAETTIVNLTKLLYTVDLKNLKLLKTADNKKLNHSKILNLCYIIWKF